MSSLWRNRDFVLLWSGQTASTLGTRTSAVAFPLLVLTMTGSPGKAGLAGFAATLPYLLFYLHAGALLDRWDRKRTMLWCDVGRVVALGSIPVALWAGRLTFAQIVVAGFAGGTFAAFFNVAERAALPALVPQAQMTAALAQQETKMEVAVLAGPPFGGFLYGLSHALPFLADAVSYVFSLVTLVFIRTDLKAERPQAAGALHHEIWAGLRWLWAQPFIRLTVLLMAVINLMFQAFTLILIVLAQKLGASSSTTGILLGLLGVGGLLGALAASRIQRRLSLRAVTIGSTWAWALLLIPIALAPCPWALAPFVAAMTFVGPVWNVVVVGYQYTVIPAELLARVKSVILLVSWGAMPFGSLSAGLLLQLTGPREAMLALAGLTLLVAAVATASRAVRLQPAPAG